MVNVSVWGFANKGAILERMKYEKIILNINIGPSSGELDGMIVEE